MWEALTGPPSFLLHGPLHGRQIVLHARIVWIELQALFVGVVCAK
jgi:hypothetical protein